MNVAPARVREADGAAEVVLDSESFILPRELLGMLEAKKATGELSLGIRPEGVCWRGSGARFIGRSRPTSSSRSAAMTSSTCKVGSADAARPHHERLRRPASARRVLARIDPAQAHFFDTAGGTSLDIGWGSSHGAHPLKTSPRSSATTRR